MKKAMKVLGILLCAVLLVVGSVAATLAYLTSKTEKITNTFTVGDVEITLTEAKIDDDGKPTGERLDGSTGNNENKYKFMPSNESYTKDPTVTVKADSDDSYVRVVVNMVGMKWSDFVSSTDFDETEWELVNEEEADKAKVKVYEFRYIGSKSTNGKIAATTADVELESLFTTINRDDTTGDYSKLDNLQSIVIEAHAIQAGGFATAADAWKEFSVANMLSPSDAQSAPEQA